MPSPSQRNLLYQKALVLFYDKGYKATTMRDIADSMNFEAPSIYNYVPSKQALLEQLLFEVADQFLDGIKHISDSNLLPLEKLQAVVELYVNVTADNPYKAALLTTEWRNLKEPALARFLKHRSSYEKYLRVLLLGYFEKSPSNLDIDIVLHSFLGSVRWICDWYIAQAGKVNPVELRHQLTNIIFKGIENIH